MKALVLAGGFPQISLIQELQSRGIFVILADYNKEPVAKKWADQYERVSTLDVEAIEQLAVREKVDFLITVCTDQALHTVAKVSEKLGLPCYIDYQTALNVTNKQYMKKVFSARNIPTARYVIQKTLDETAIAHLRYPLIVKPVDCNSSKGVRRCENIEDTRKFFQEAVTASRTDTAIIEEFIEGAEISVDVYVEDGKAHVLCVSNSDKIRDKDKFVIFRAIWPSPVSDDILRQIETTVQRIADAFGIRNSPMLVQFLSDGKNVYVIEFSARTGGGVKHLLVRRASGFNVIRAVVDLTLGLKPHVGEIRAEQRYMVNDFLYCTPGVYDHLEGFSELVEEGYMKDYYIFKWRGALFGEIKASGNRVAGYTVTADSAEELVRKHNIVRSRIKVISSEGQDMLRHDLLTDLCIRDGYLYSSK